MSKISRSYRYALFAELLETDNIFREYVNVVIMLYGDT